MKFCDLAQFMYHNYEEKANAGEFVKMLIDAILDDARWRRILQTRSTS